MIRVPSVTVTPQSASPLGDRGVRIRSERTGKPGSHPVGDPDRIRAGWERGGGGELITSWPPMYATPGETRSGEELGRGKIQPLRDIVDRSIGS